jgi:hypothetical protein
MVHRRVAARKTERACPGYRPCAEPRLNGAHALPSGYNAVRFE